VTLRRAVAVPFLGRETEEVTRAEFVYTLSADKGWFDPEEAEKIAERGVEQGLLGEEDGDLIAEFDLDGVEESESKPEVRGEERGTFERAVEILVSSGYERREAVARINRRHATMGDARIEAAALLALRQEGVEVSSLAEEALKSL